MSLDAAHRSSPPVDEIVATLVELIREVAGPDLPASFETTGPESIRDLALTSVRILEYLVRVEDHFGIEWEEQLDPAVISSFESMAAYVAKERSDDDAGA